MKARPCPEGKHVDDEDATEQYVYCESEYCIAGAFRCRRCGWWVTDCQCGCCRGAARISPKQEAAIRRRHALRVRSVAIDPETGFTVSRKPLCGERIA